MDEAFYARLPLHAHFREVLRPDAYRPVPATWHVAVTDVRASTAAIAEGHYKEVTLAGAAALVALLNEAHPADLPFVYGGDGAAVLVPPPMAAAARRVLGATRTMARRALGLDLRAALVPVAALYAEGHALAVARLHLAPEAAQAMFAGSGLAAADALLKAGHYAVAEQPEAEADFSHLECRWEDVPSRRQEVVALLVATPAAQPDTFARVLAQVEAHYGGEDAYRPVTPEVLLPSFRWRQLAHEARIRRPAGRLHQALHTAKSWAQNGLLKFFVRHKIQTGDVRWDRYLDQLAATSDFRKLDGMLRMVLAGTPAQRAALTAFLEAEQQAGRLAYGLHASDRALLVCAVFQRLGRQVHFVDAAEGGYALAAQALKARLAERTPAAGNRPAYNHLNPSEECP